MKRRFAITSLIVGLIGLASPLSAADNREVVTRGKGATAFVEVKDLHGEASGSGFCVDKSGLFITNAHVVEGVPVGAEGRVKLIINIGSKNQKILDAKVYRTDPDYDLALLKVPTIPGLVPLTIGKDDDLFETQDVTCFGFPLGKLMALARGAYPDMSISPGRISSLKKIDEKLKLVQFTGQINPGNSGGPLIDTDGRVVGVATLTVRGSGLNYAIPPGRLAEFLEAPGLDFDPPLILHRNRASPLTWTIRVVPPKPDDKPLANLEIKLVVGIAVNDGEEPLPVATRSIGNGVFQANLTPVPTISERMIRVDTVIDGQEHQLWLRDREVLVAGRKLLASDLRQVVRQGNPRVVTVKGETINGRITGFPKMKSKLGPTTMTVDLETAGSMTLKANDGSTPVIFVEARVEASRAGKVLASVVRRVQFSGDLLDLTPRAVASNTPPPVVPPPARPNPATPNRPSAVEPTPARPNVAPPRPPTALESRMDDLVAIQIKGNLNATDNPLGAGLSIRPPSVPMGEVSAAITAAAQDTPRRLAGHTNGIWSVAISPDGRQALSGSHDLSVRL